MTDLRYALWAAAAGALIPVMAALNARLGRSLGDPGHAAMVLFAVAFAATSLVCLAFSGGGPSLSALAAAQPIDFSGGLIVAGYVLSITLLVRAFGVGNAILFVVTAQLFTSTAIDHFGLFGAAIRPLTGLRALGLALLLGGAALTQLAR